MRDYSDNYLAGASTAKDLKNLPSSEIHTDQMILQAFRDQITNLQKKTHQLSFILSEVDDILKCAMSPSMRHFG